jgi:hypothetical protein
MIVVTVLDEARVKFQGALCRPFPNDGTPYCPIRAGAARSAATARGDGGGVGLGRPARQAFRVRCDNRKTPDGAGVVRTDILDTKSPLGKAFVTPALSPASEWRILY